MDLNELQARREAAIERGERWSCSADELLVAYAAGERDFRSADLRHADLYRANLVSADLRIADLSGANLYSADLSGANLSGADLSGANLYRADLTCSDLPERFHILQIAPVGSRRAELQARIDVDGTQTVRTGCFSGTLAEFEAAVARKTEGDPYRLEYERIVIPAIEAFFELHTVKQGA